MAGHTRRSRRRKRAGDAIRHTLIVISAGAVLAVGLFAAGDYVVATRRATTSVKAFLKPATDRTDTKTAAAAGDDEIYTGSILYIPYEGTNCRQLLFDNRNGRFTDNGDVDCVHAAYQSGIGSPKQWSAARVKVISTGFRDR
jgi:hypothetical protein